MAKYVLQHGNISLGTAGEPLSPSADPAKPTTIELDEAEAAKLNGPKGVLLEGSKGHPPALVLLSEYEAERASSAAGAAARAKVLASHAEKPKADEKPKGGGK